MNRSILIFLALAALALIPGIAAADDSLCGYCSDGCNGGSFLGYPMCGTAFGSCSVCRVDCELGFGGTTCYCTLYSCASGGDTPPPLIQIASLHNPKVPGGPCQLAQLSRKSYRAVRIEVFSARS